MTASHACFWLFLTGALASIYLMQATWLDESNPLPLPLRVLYRLFMLGTCLGMLVSASHVYQTRVEPWPGAVLLVICWVGSIVVRAIQTEMRRRQIELAKRREVIIAKFLPEKVRPDYWGGVR